jgi:hypothetical protein
MAQAGEQVATVPSFGQRMPGALHTAQTCSVVAMVDNTQQKGEQKTFFIFWGVHREKIILRLLRNPETLSRKSDGASVNPEILLGSESPGIGIRKRGLATTMSVATAHAARGLDSYSLISVLIPKHLVEVGKQFRVLGSGKRSRGLPSVQDDDLSRVAA